MENDRVFLKRALEIAANGIEEGGGPFGAVITHNNKVIAQSFNKVVLTNDPTAHAEILAIREAASVLKTHDLKDCVLYTSCEPCPMCLGAIYWSGIKKIVFAADRLDAAASGFSDSLIYDELALKPEKRQVAFIHVPDEGGKEVFRLWDEFENRITY